MNAPLVSVVIPTHDRAGLLPRAVESVLASSSLAIDVVVVDDASADDTLAVLRRYDDPRLSVVALPVNVGVCGARKAGIEAAKGAWVAFLDSDDTLQAGWEQVLTQILVSLPTEVAGLILQCVDDDWTVTPKASPESGPMSYAAYLRMIGRSSLERSDTFSVLRREALAASPYPDGRQPEIVFNLDFVRRFPHRFERRALYRVHRDAGDRLTASRQPSDPHRRICAADADLDLFERHGEAIARHGGRRLFAQLLRRGLTRQIELGRSREAKTLLRLAWRLRAGRGTAATFYALGRLSPDLPAAATAAARRVRGAIGPAVRPARTMLGRLRAAPVLRDAGRLAVGAAAAQLITLASAPLLTRLCSPTAMGSFGAFLGVAAIATAAPCLNLQQALLLEEEDDGRARVLALCLWVLAAVTATSAALAVLGRSGLAAVLGSAAADCLMWTGPALVISGGLYTLGQFMSLREGRFRRLSAFQGARAALATVGQVGLALLRPAALSLAAGQAAGQLLALPILWLGQGPPWRAGLARMARPRDLLPMFGRYRRFALYGAPQSILNGVSGALPTVLLTASFGAAQAGFFWLGYRVLALPNQVVMESLRGALFPRFAQARRSGGEGAGRLLARQSGFIALVMAPAAGALMMGGPVVFQVVFGVAWREAGTAAQILALGWLAQNVAVPATVVLTVYERQRFFLMVEIANIAARASALAWGGALHDAHVALALYTLAAIAHSVLIVAAAATACRGGRARD